MTDGHEHEHHQDPTFYRSPRDAAAAPAEKLAYVATFSRPADQPDAMAVVDVDPQSAGLQLGGRASPSCPTSATSCITSAGTPARARCARAAGTITATGAT